MDNTIIIAGIIAIVLILLGSLSKFFPDNRKIKLTFEAYSLKESIATNRERKLYELLTKEIPSKYQICPKVGIKDFVGIRTKSNYMSYFRRISQKHIDFLICEKETLKPVLGIELDDRSHQREDRQKRDEFVNALYENIGLKMLRIPTSMNDDEIKKELTTIFSPPIEMYN